MLCEGKSSGGLSLRFLDAMSDCDAQNYSHHLPTGIRVKGIFRVTRIERKIKKSQVLGEIIKLLNQSTP